MTWHGIEMSSGWQFWLGLFFTITGFSLLVVLVPMLIKDLVRHFCDTLDTARRNRELRKRSKGSS